MARKKKAAAKKKPILDPTVSTESVDPRVFDADVVVPATVYTFEDELAFADFPCEAAEAEARSLYAIHGVKFVDWCASKTGALPISLLIKVARAAMSHEEK